MTRWEVWLFVFEDAQNPGQLPEGWEPFAAEFWGGSRIWAKREIRD